MRRAGAFALALLQFGAATAIVGGDAVLESRHQVHLFEVDTFGSEETADHHDHLFCQVVNSLASVAGSHDIPTQVAAGAPIDMSVAPLASMAPVAAVMSGAAGPRAPPLA